MNRWFACLSRTCNIFILVTVCFKLEACFLSLWNVVYWPDPRSTDMGSPANIFLGPTPSRVKLKKSNSQKYYVVDFIPKYL